jgi:hypothetical protein
MSEGRMAEVVSETCCLDERLWNSKPRSEASSDLRDFNRVRHPGSNKVSPSGGEDLRLALQSAKCHAVDDPSPIPFEGRPHIAL